MENSTIVWDVELIKKYNSSGPRYTSYPTALEFNPQYSEIDFQQAIAKYPQRPLSLYIHIPFCHRLCYFCACNKVITRHAHKADEYLDWLEREIRYRAPQFAGRQVSQMHWGGGTPTFLSAAQISRLNGLLTQYFSFCPTAERSIELDPREISLDILDHLRAEGFTRLSMGIQDFNKEVQQRVNRVQDEAFIFALVQRAREQGFISINVDLIYGLPQQTLDSFAFTLQRVIELNPDRLSVFNYAHLPARFAAQRKINDLELPSPEQKLALLQQTIASLNTAGYQFIGMDHFAKPTDELAIAQQKGILHRNFQGYTTQGEADLLGLGVSAISMLGDSYAQNQRELVDYYAAVEGQGYALCKGLALSKDDCLRRDLIKQLLCNFLLLFAPLEQQYDVIFTEYFAQDLLLLAPLAKDKLVEIGCSHISVTAKGRLLIRNICLCFDVYFRNQARQQQFSRVI